MCRDILRNEPRLQRLVMQGPAYLGLSAQAVMSRAFGPGAILIEIPGAFLNEINESGLWPWSISYRDIAAGNSGNSRSSRFAEG